MGRKSGTGVERLSRSFQETIIVIRAYATFFLHVVGKITEMKFLLLPLPILSLHLIGPMTMDVIFFQISASRFLR